jgi:adenine phosphoribosyltransferase
MATATLLERLGGKVVGIATLIELAFLGGRDRLAAHELFSLITYD